MEEIESLIKELFLKKIPAPGYFVEEFYQTATHHQIVPMLCISYSISIYIDIDIDIVLT